jgi:predicted ATPase
MAQLSSRRYEIRGVLGKGGTGVVYEAYDSKDHTLVALKTIDAREAEHLYRLKHEFRALADVQHENIVRFGELSQEDGQWFFSMELVRGENVLEYVRPRAPGHRAEGGAVDATTTIVRHLLPDSGDVAAADPISVRGDATFDEARLRSVLGQLASALSVIHEAGHVHRDVKPANVLVTGEGRVVLLDFGLVTALAERGRHPEPPWVVGTPAFMAPEHLEGETLGPDADWYAVGVILYLALTGTLPFDGSARDIFTAKREREPPPPHERAPGIPPDLDALCMDLLRRIPSERPREEAIRARLGIARDDAPRSVGAGEAGAVFVGRDAEIGALGQALQQAVDARSARVVVVEGEPGIGKSSVVQHFLKTLPEGVLALSGRCYEQESVPFKGVDTMIDSLSEWLVARPDAEIDLLIAGGVRHLATVFPVLSRVAKIAAATRGAREAASAAALREQAYGELERLFVALAARGPLVLFVDDLQWAGDDSIALLRRALFQPKGARCLLVATIRAGAEMSDDATALLRTAERISLRGLSDAESTLLVDALWIRNAPRADASRERLLREAAGHPLFLAELVRSARAGHVQTHATLQEVLWERIQVRDAVDRRYLEFVAIAGAPTPYDVVARAADLDVGECQARLGALRAAQLVRVTRRGDDRLVEPYHDRIRESVADHVASRPDGARDVAERHLRLGRALRDATPESSLPQRVFAILTHLDAGRALLVGRRERLDVAALHLVASRTARRTTAYDRARHHAGEGLALVGASGWTEVYALTRDLSIERMEAEYLAGRADLARASFESARAKLTALEDKVTLYTAWIVLETAHGRFTEAIGAAREILRELGAPLPDRVSTGHVLRQYAANRIAQGRRKIDDLADLPTLRDPAREHAMKTLIALAPAAYSFDTNLLTWILLRIAGDSMTHGVCDVSSYGFAGYGMVLGSAFGRYAEGGAFGRLALKLDDRFENESLAAKLCLLHGAFILAWTRPIAEAKEALRRAHAEAIRSDDTAYEAFSVVNTSIMAFCEGVSPESLQATGEWAREICARQREGDMAAANSALARYAASLRGLTPRLLDFGIEGSSDAEFGASIRGKTVLSRFLYDYCRAELAYLDGETDRAHALLVEAATVGSKAIFGMLMTVELAWLEALVAARRFDTAAPTERPRLLWTVATRVRKLRTLAKINPASFETHYLMALAELQRITGRTTTAGKTLERAVRAARAHGSSKREAIALDLASSRARLQGDMAHADALRRQANDAYRSWGAARLADRGSSPPTIRG